MVGGAAPGDPREVVHEEGRGRKRLPHTRQTRKISASHIYRLATMRWSEFKRIASCRRNVCWCSESATFLDPDKGRQHNYAH